jgi:hypothetical protein
MIIVMVAIARNGVGEWMVLYYDYDYGYGIMIIIAMIDDHARNGAVE